MMHLIAPDETHPALLDDDALLADCVIWTGKRGGPGGQHRHKTDSAILFEHRPTGIVGQASERRSQAENRGQALRRLRLALALEVRRPRSSIEPPSELWQQRCRHGRIVVSAEHADLPRLLAEALDVLWDHQGHVPAAAADLHCSASQFLKLLAKAPAAWECLNRYRARFHLPQLKFPE